MVRSLVLNATYEPLSVVTGRRAAVLVLNERADLVHESGDVLRSARLEVPVPSVIRLRSFVRVPYPRRNAITRRGVFARDGNRCQYCGGRAESIDHVKPRSRGGGHSWDNVVAACRACNTRKRDRFLSETTMRLASVPRAPSRTGWVAVAVGRVPESWLEYLDTAVGAPSGAGLARGA